MIQFFDNRLNVNVPKLVLYNTPILAMNCTHTAFPPIHHRAIKTYMPTSDSPDVTKLGPPATNKYLQHDRKQSNRETETGAINTVSNSRAGAALDSYTRFRRTHEHAGFPPHHWNCTGNWCFLKCHKHVWTNTTSKSNRKRKQAS